MIYLEERPGPAFEPWVVRSRDLKFWEASDRNPALRHSDEDKLIRNPHLPDARRRRIQDALNRNNSDVDLCEHEGRTVLYYSWGDQEGTEFLAEAVFDGSLTRFFRAFFPEEGAAA